MKKLINDPNDVVAEALLGIEAAHPDLRVDHAQQDHLPRRRARGRARSGIISGGGSGHEPLHGGFVGLGMLDAACAGEVFTSPVPDQMLAATKLVDGGAGVLHVVKNYTGDVMNFEMAAELAAAETGARGRLRGHRRRRRRAGQHLDGRPARRRRHRAAGEDRRRRGRAGPRPRRRSPTSPARSTPTAAAWAWRSPRAPCRRPASRRSSSARTRWSSASASTASPAAQRRAAGARPRRSPRCWSSRSWPTCRSARGDAVIAFVNGLGGTPLIELYVMYNEVNKILAAHGVQRGPLAGRLRTSPRWTWPAPRSRCSRSTTSCCRSGTLRSGRRP